MKYAQKEQEAESPTTFLHPEFLMYVQRLHLSDHRIYTFRRVAFIKTQSYYAGPVKVRGLEVRR
jgi:hypothetical protein